MQFAFNPLNTLHNHINLLYYKLAGEVDGRVSAPTPAHLLRSEMVNFCYFVHQLFSQLINFLAIVILKEFHFFKFSL